MWEPIIDLFWVGRDSMEPKRFREMNIWERRLVDKLLEIPFPGSRDLAIQLRDSLVCSIDENGSVDFLVSTKKKVSVHNPIPVEAEAEDSDGITIHLLLHVIDGIARGIEVYKEDSSDVIKFPDPTALRLFSPP